MRVNLKGRFKGPEILASASPFAISCLVLIAAWALYGFGDALNDGSYDPLALIAMLVATAVIGLVVLLRSPPATSEVPRAVIIGMAFVAALCLLWSIGDPAGIYGKGPLLLASRSFTVAACFVTFVCLVTRFRRPLWTLLLTATISVASGVTMIMSSPRPAIDVWYMLQAGSHALAHGHNIYTQHWALSKQALVESGQPSEGSNHFSYLPGTALFLTPFYALFGDVRYGILAAIVATALLIGRMGNSEVFPYLGCLFLIFPKMYFLVEQSYSDPLVLLAITAAVFFVQKKRVRWAVVALVGALWFKQYALFLVPLAFFWKPIGPRRTLIAVGAAAVLDVPWVLASPSAFWRGVVKIFVNLAPRSDSLSLDSFLLRHGYDPGLLVSATAVVLALGLTIRRSSKNSLTFVLGLTFSMAMFNLFGKQQFFNQWMLVGGYCVLALAVWFASADAPCEEGVQNTYSVAPTSSTASLASSF